VQRDRCRSEKALPGQPFPARGSERTAQATNTETNKTLVREFYDLAFNQEKPSEAAARYLGTTYQQTTRLSATGPRAFVEFVIGFTKQFPNLKATPKVGSRTGTSLFA